MPNFFKSIETVFRGHFLQLDVVVRHDGRAREIVRKGPAVAVLVYDPVANEAAFIEQSREPLISEKNPGGKIIEVPAGHIEKGEMVAEVVARELWEEIGVVVAPAQVELLNNGLPVRVSPGWTTEQLMLAYVELTPGQRSQGNEFGNAAEGEKTKVVWIRAELLPDESGSIFEDLKTWALVQWFLRIRARKRAMPALPLPCNPELMRGW